MKDIESMTAKELYDETKYKLYPNSHDSVQVWCTREVSIDIKGIQFYIKSSKADNNVAYVHIHGTCDDEINLDLYDEFRTVKKLIEAINKKLILFAKKILKEK